MKNTKMLLQVLLSMVLIFILILPAPAVKASPAVDRPHEHCVGCLAADSTSAASTTTPNTPRGKVTPMVSAGGQFRSGYTVGLKSDGTLIAVGDNYYGQCNVGEWSGVVQVAAGYRHAVALKSDGTVVAVGSNYDGECNVGGWTDITQIAAGGDHTVGLKSDGTVVAVGMTHFGQCNVGGWTGIVQVAAGESYTLGLKSDGTVVAVGLNTFGQCNVGEWTGIVRVAAGRNFSIGLKSDGTVVAVGNNWDGQCNVGGWTGIVQVAAGGAHTVGLRTDRTALAVGHTYNGQCNVDDWTNIIQVATGYLHTVGLKADGSVVAVGLNTSGQCNVGGWNLGEAAPSTLLSFTKLTPPNVTTSNSTYDAEFTATGTNFNNVDLVTFTWSGPDSGTDTWDKGDSDWNSKVKVNSDTSMTLRPRVLYNGGGTQSKTWTWTVTLRDAIGATASRTFTVTYTPTSEDLNAIIQALTIDRVEVTLSGQSYFILTLEHRIDRTTLQIAADSGQTKVYVDVSGNPVSDGEVAQKIGIIETAREMGDLQLSQRIAALEAMREAASQRTGREWVNLVTSGVVDLIKAAQWQQKYNIYNFAQYWDNTRDIWRTMNDATVMRPPTGILAKAATALIQKLFGDPFGEIKKDLQNSLSSAISHYNSIAVIANRLVVDYDEAYKFLSNFYYGKSKEEMAHYLNGKIGKNVVNLFDTAGPIANILTLSKNVPVLGLALGLLEFPKLAWEARLATDWTVDTLYKDVVNRYQNNADLLYKFTDAAEYSLELAQAHEEVTSYKVKCLNEQATGRAEAQKIPQAVSDYLWDIDTWWDSFVTVMTLGRLRSPGEFRVYDSQGRVTGLVNREVREEIPEAVYSDGAVLIFNATDSYRYEVVGTNHGTYGLEITSKEGEEAQGLAFAGVAIVPYEIHRYTVGGGTLSGGQTVATIEIDSDGDGVAEETKTLRPPTAAFTFSPSTITINKEINFDASQSSDADGQIVSYQWNFGDGNTAAGETARHAYSMPAEYSVSLAVLDNDGVVCTYSRSVQVGERQGMPTWGWAIIAIGILVLAVMVFRKLRAVKVQR